MLINPFNPLVECAFAFGGGVKPFVHATFRPFSLSEWEFEIVLFQGVDTYQAVLNALTQEHAKQYIYPCHAVLDAASKEQTILPLSKGEDRMLNERKRINSILGEGSFCRVDTCHAVLNAISQEHAKQYIYSCHPELDSGSIQDDFLSISINRFRVKHGMTIKGALDTASQEQAKLESSLSQGKGFNPYPSPLTGEGERSSDEGDIKTSSKRCACYGLSNLFKHNGRLKSTLHGCQTSHLNSNMKGRYKSQQIQASHLNTSVKERCKSLCFKIWHLNTSVKGRYKSQQFQAWHNNSNMKGGDNKCLA